MNGFDDFVAAATALATSQTFWPCSELAWRVVIDALDLTDAGPGTQAWKDANVWDRKRPWSGPEAALHTGAASRLDWGPRAHPTPRRWHLVQGFRRLTPEGHVPEEAPGRLNGHEWLWWAVTGDTGYALEASMSKGVRLNGRSILDKTAPAPGPERWRGRIRPFTAGVRMAVLRHPFIN